MNPRNDFSGGFMQGAQAALDGHDYTTCPEALPRYAELFDPTDHDCWLEIVEVLYNDETPYRGGWFLGWWFATRSLRGLVDVDARSAVFGAVAIADITWEALYA